MAKAETKGEHARRLRERAARMWREDGSPKGRQAEYLERARELQAIEDHPGFGLLPNPMAQLHGSLPPEQPVEEAELMENLGEFPVGLTDQGDRNTVPMVRKKARRALRET